MPKPKGPPSLDPEAQHEHMADSAPTILSRIRILLPKGIDDPSPGVEERLNLRLSDILKLLTPADAEALRSDVRRIALWHFLFETSDRKRVSDVRKQLTALHKATEELLVRISDLDLVTREIVEESVDPTAPDRGWSTGDFLTLRLRLKDLDRWITDLLNSLPTPSTRDNRQVWPKSAKRYLVSECLHLFLACREDRPTSTVTGPFLKLVSLVYEVATGEDSADLATTVKQVIKAYKNGAL